MRSVARVIADVDGNGVTRIFDLVESAPIGFRMTRDALYLVGTAQGMLGADDISIDLIVREGATLCVRSAAATIAYASVGARLSIRCHVEQGAHLDWYPEPIIATHRCRAQVVAEVSIDRGGSLRWTEECLLGRSDESPGDLDLGLRIDYDGYALLRHQLAVGPSVLSWNGPAGVGGRRCVSYRVIVDAEEIDVTKKGREVQRERQHDGSSVSDALQDAQWAVLDLDGPGTAVVAVADDLVDLRRQMQCAEAVLRTRDLPLKGI